MELKESGAARVHQGDARRAETITLSCAMLKEVMVCVCPDEDQDQLETEVTFFYREEDATSDEGDPMPKGFYCYLTEYPEEGVYGPLGEAVDAAADIQEKA